MHNKIFVLVFSIALSAALLYIFKSTTKRQILFRTLVAGISLFLIFLVFQPKDENSIKIFPRDNIVLVQVTNPAKNIFLILDRKKQKYIPNDYAVFKYISSLRKPKELVYTGFGGKKIAEMLMRNNKINIHEIDLIQTEILLKRLNLNNTIYQQIEL